MPRHSLDDKLLLPVLRSGSSSYTARPRPTPRNSDLLITPNRNVYDDFDETSSYGSGLSLNLAAANNSFSAKWLTLMIEKLTEAMSEYSWFTSRHAASQAFGVLNQCSLHCSNKISNSASPSHSHHGSPRSLSDMLLQHPSSPINFWGGVASPTPSVDNLPTQASNNNRVETFLDCFYLFTAGETLAADLLSDENGLLLVLYDCAIEKFKDASSELKRHCLRKLDQTSALALQMAIQALGVCATVRRQLVEIQRNVFSLNDQAVDFEQAGLLASALKQTLQSTVAEMEHCVPNDDDDDDEGIGISEEVEEFRRGLKLVQPVVTRFAEELACWKFCFETCAALEQCLYVPVLSVKS